MLTVRQSVARVPHNETVRFLRRDVDYWMAEDIALWHRTTGELETAIQQLRHQLEVPLLAATSSRHSLECTTCWSLSSHIVAGGEGDRSAAARRS